VQSRRANRRGRLLQSVRCGAHSLHTKGMSQLFRKRRIRLNLNSSRSRPPQLAASSLKRRQLFQKLAATRSYEPLLPRT
jgi:hypothetical protein